MLLSVRGHVFMIKRDYVFPDDVAQIARYALNHRIETSSSATTVDEVIDDVLRRVRFE